MKMDVRRLAAGEKYDQCPGQEFEAQQAIALHCNNIL